MLLLEAGGDPRAPYPPEPGATPRLPDDYDVPAFHSIASEHRDLAWNFFVSHHDDPAADARDPKFRREHEGRRVDGFLYPRAGTLGGCTAHNAMIWVYPHNADWDRHRRADRRSRRGRRRRCAATSSGSKTAATVRSTGRSPASA